MGSYPCLPEPTLDTLFANCHEISVGQKEKWHNHHRALTSIHHNHIGLQNMQKVEAHSTLLTNESTTEPFLDFSHVTRDAVAGIDTNRRRTRKSTHIEYHEAQRLVIMPSTKLPLL
jgi:hypothetical protein